MEENNSSFLFLVGQGKMIGLARNINLFYNLDVHCKSMNMILILILKAIRICKNSKDLDR